MIAEDKVRESITSLSNIKYNRLSPYNYIAFHDQLEIALDALHKMIDILHTDIKEKMDGSSNT